VNIAGPSRTGSGRRPDLCKFLETVATASPYDSGGIWPCGPIRSGTDRLCTVPLAASNLLRNVAVEPRIRIRVSTHASIVFAHIFDGIL
jgi:hypothetical protein